ncbi:MAG: FAD-dependent oxidoreductase [Bacteroidota bacterium]|nr:FAD-dependent oxidoreductase [Bacteroidota bacterium]
MSFFNIKGILNPLLSLSQFGKKPHTLNFPEIDVEGADRYRGLHYNDIEACIGCGNCSTICMNEAIDMIQIAGVEASNGDSGLRPRVDNGRCCWCGLCVEVCPVGSLSLTKDYIFVTDDADDFLWTPGVDNPEGEKQRSWVSQLGESLNEYKRVPMPELDGMERVKSFAEVVLGYREQEAREEASRCISCGLCTEACPEHMHIPEYINAIANAQDEDALRIIYDNNPLPEMCGKVCTRRCEEVCAVAKRGEPIAIRWLKAYATETAENSDMTKEIVNPKIDEPNGFKVGIVGAGPAGLTAGYYLALRGFDVTIYEMQNKAGGMTMWGIPKYRLPLDSLDKQIEYMQKVGVKINFNTTVGKDIQFEEIYNNYDAVFVGIGFQKPWTLGIDGEDLPGVVSAIDYLMAINGGKTFDVGNKVAVIGGGNVAIDGARVSARYGADVTILYRRRVEDMPADWEEIEGAEDEGINFVPQGVPIKFIPGDDGKVKYVRYLKAEMVDDGKGGRPRPVPIEGSETDLEVTTVIGAIGQEADYSFLPKEYQDRIGIERGRMKTVNEYNQSNDPKIYVGGDAVNRTADAISAIADGYKAMKGIVKMLLKED